MFRYLLAGIVAGMIFVATCSAEIIVSVGDIELLPDLAGQKVPILVTSNDPDISVDGINFRIRVGSGNGNPKPSGPKITAVDLVYYNSANPADPMNTIFGPNNDGVTGSTLYPWSYSASVMTHSGVVDAEGTLAWVTFDTTSVLDDAYGPWTVELKDIFSKSTNFTPSSVTTKLESGTITIKQLPDVPEPNALILLAGAAGMAFVAGAIRRKRGRNAG